MDVLHPRCAGLDVHKRTVVATVRRVEPAGEVEVRPTRPDLEEIARLASPCSPESSWHERSSSVVPESIIWRNFQSRNGH
jgi:hypothetical protein